MRIIPLSPGASFGSNCYLLIDGDHAVVVDPSTSASSILKTAKELNCTLDAILLTHAHFDHIYSVDTLRRSCPGLPLYVHEGDAPMLTDGKKNGFTFFFGEDRQYMPAEQILTDGQHVPVGSSSLTVLHTPGHSPGSVCFLGREDGFLLTGDTLFHMNVGRCDLWGGDHAALMASLNRLKALPPDLTIFPGHGQTDMLGQALQDAFYS